MNADPSTPTGHEPAADPGGVVVPPEGSGPSSATSRKVLGVDENRIAWVVLIGALVALAAGWWYMRRGQPFDGLDIDVFALYHGMDIFEPYHGHLSVLPAGIYKVLMNTFGVGSTWPYAVVSLVIYGSIAVAMFCTHYRRTDPILTALLSVATIWAWSTRDNLRFNFMINFYLPALMLIIAWEMIRRNDRRSDAVSAAAITVGLASSGVGLVGLCAVVVELTLRRQYRRILWYVPQTAAWLVWYATTRDSTGTVGESGVLEYAWQVTVSILSGFTLGWRPGALLTAAGLVALGVTAHRKWKTFDAHLVAIGVASVFFVVLIAISRSTEAGATTPFSPRYIWFGNLLLIAFVLGCLRGRRLDWPTLGVVTAVVAVGAAAMFVGLRQNRAWLYSTTFTVTPRLQMIVAAGDHLDPSDSLLYGDATVGDYQKLVDSYGVPGPQPEPGGKGVQSILAVNDRRLIEVEGIVAEPSAAPPTCPSGWRRLEGAAGRHGARIEPGSWVFVTPADSERAWLKLRRFAVSFDDAWAARSDVDESFLVRVPRDEATYPWFTQVKPTATAQVCRPTGGVDTAD